MARHYIIDGYNVIKQLEILADLKLQTGRETLLGMIERLHPQGSDKNQVTVVFDGQESLWGEQHSLHSKVVFTSGSSADEWIKKAVEGHEHPKSLVVVSDDREIQCYVRKFGAEVRGVVDFFSEGKKNLTHQSPGSARDLKHISPADERRINEELGKLWIQEDP